MGHYGEGKSRFFSIWAEGWKFEKFRVTMPTTHGHAADWLQFRSPFFFGTFEPRSKQHRLL